MSTLRWWLILRIFYLVNWWSPDLAQRFSEWAGLYQALRSYVWRMEAREPWDGDFRAQRSRDA